MQLSLPLTSTVPERDAIIFVRHRRARRYILRVLPDGAIRVTLPRWGAKRDALAFVEQSGAWIAREQAKRRQQRQAAALAPTRDFAAEMAVKQRARRDLPQELLTLAALYGIDVRRVSVRDQRTRWGACSRAGTITLNWRLILTPPFVRHYVLVHELMHRRELNHSRRFWRLVAAHCPRMDDARAWLRTEGKALWSDAD